MADVDISRLCAAIRSSRDALKVFQDNRLEIAKQCAGDRFSDGGADERVKLNLLSLYHETFSSLLVANEPRYLMTTPDLPSRAAVRVEQDWLNEQASVMELGETGRIVVSDALMSTGICKVALASPCEAAILNWGISAGEPIAVPVDIDDFVYGTASRSFSTTEFIGHRFRCPLEVARELYGKKAVESADDLSIHNEEGNERITTLGHGHKQPEEFEDHVDLWEIYLPRHKRIIILLHSDILEGGDDGKRPTALHEAPAICPPWGPYLFLKFGRVAGAAMAKAPMMDLYELHMDTNNIHRKANRTLRNLKENIGYRRSANKDAESLRLANHLDFVPMEDPEAFKVISMGGTLVQPLLTAAAVYQDLFNFQGGNLSLLGGRKAQSDTLGQDKILNANAGSGVVAMQNKVQAFMSALGASMMWYAHHHPELVMESEYRPQGSRGINRKLYPASVKDKPNRDFPFSRSKMRLDAYSIQHKTPEERLAAIMTLVDKITPMLPLAAQQNIQVDMEALVDVMAEYSDLPEFKSVLTVREAVPQGEGPAGGSHERTMPTATERTYTRRDEGGEEGAAQKLAEMSAVEFSQNGQPQG